MGNETAEILRAIANVTDLVEWLCFMVVGVIGISMIVILAIVIDRKKGGK